MNATEQSAKERRRWDRLPICVPMFVRWTNGQNRRLQEFATAVNISAGGALLAILRYVPVGTKVELEIPCAPVINEISLDGATKQFTAEVVRVELRQKVHFMAASFTNPAVG